VGNSAGEESARNKGSRRREKPIDSVIGKKKGSGNVKEKFQAKRFTKKAESIVAGECPEL